MQTSHSNKRKPCRGFHDPDATTQAKKKNSGSNKNLKAKAADLNNETGIIKKISNRYDDLKKIEPLLRIHAQANSGLEQVYRGLYTISKEEKNIKRQRNGLINGSGFHPIMKRVHGNKHNSQTDSETLSHSKRLQGN